MSESERPLSDLKVVDLGLGMAAALVSKFLVESAASVTRVEPPEGDPFRQVHAATETWLEGTRIDPQASRSSERLDALLAEADVCILGGEDHPAVRWRHDAAALHERHPRLVVLNIEGYPGISRHADRPACDLLVQARSGLSFEHYSQRPLLMGFEPSHYGAALHGLAGLFGALIQRERTGRGQIVATSLFEGALAWVLLLWYEGGNSSPGFRFVMPKDPYPLIFRCADGPYIQVVIGSAGSKGRLYRILGVDDPSVDINDSGMPKPTEDVKNFFGDVDLLAAYIGKRNSRELLEAIWAEGLPAEPVLRPGECWDDAQVVHNGIVKRSANGVRHVAHPIYSRASPAPHRPFAAGGSRPLSGVKVIDFGAFVAGPYSSVVLADLGAEVIKVEALTGDPNRSVFRAYQSVARGKRAITLDLKTPEGRRIAEQLCMGADVVTNNFRPGVSARLGIDARTLHALKPELVVLESGAYGQSGPKAGLAGFDMSFQALCGHDWRAGGTGNPPLWNRTSMVDFASGLLGAIGVLRQLYVRACTGAGAEVGGSLLNAGVYLLSELIQRPNGEFAGAPQLNHEQTGYHPAERFYQAADGWIAVAARDEASARSLLEVLGLSSSIRRERAAWREEEGGAIAQAIRTRSVGELASALERAGVWAEECRRTAEHDTLNDPDLAAAGTVYQCEHPKFGAMKQIGPLFRLSAGGRAEERPSPLPGQHSDEILRELGYSSAEIGALRERKVIA